MTNTYTKLQENVIIVDTPSKPLLSERLRNNIELKKMGVSPLLRMFFYISKINLNGTKAN